MRWVPVAGAALLGACAAEPPAPPAPPSIIEVERIQAVLPLDGPLQPLLERPVAPCGGGRAGAARREVVVERLRRFGGGRLDGLHVRLPPALANGDLAGALVRAGVNPRKISADAPPGRLVVARYIAHPPRCAPVGPVSGAAWNQNAGLPGLGCSLLTNLAMTVADPADLLWNAAAPAGDSERAARPVARLRGIAGGAEP